METSKPKDRIKPYLKAQSEVFQTLIDKIDSVLDKGQMDEFGGMSTIGDNEITS